MIETRRLKNVVIFIQTILKVACRVRVAYLKEENHHFSTVFLNKFLKHVFNLVLFNIM